MFNEADTPTVTHPEAPAGAPGVGVACVGSKDSVREYGVPTGGTLPGKVERLEITSPSACQVTNVPATTGEARTSQAQTNPTLLIINPPERRVTATLLPPGELAPREFIQKVT
jgi:hypothetical protein